jgi:hypothetical protein
LLVVDSNDQPVAMVVDGLQSLRKIGNDWVVLQTLQTGFPEQDVFFYHTKSDCSDARLFNVSPTVAYFGVVHTGALFYAKDFSVQHVVAYESIPAGTDAVPLAPVCHSDSTTDFGNLEVGVVQTVVDPAISTLAPPFRIR